MQTLPDQEIVVVGGGLVGAAVAWGLARKGLRPLVLDGEDLAHRASRANFALVWVQGKGLGAPHYARWTIGSAKLWPSFSEELKETSGIDVALRQRGGFTFALSESEMGMWSGEVRSVAAALGEDAPEHVLLDHAGTARMVPAIGKDVVGSIYSPIDGDVNSLRLFRALHAGMVNLGASYRAHSDVTEILPKAGGFLLKGAWGDVFAGRVVLAAGNGNARLAPMVGLSAPTLQSKGQILVTEKCEPFFPYTSTTLRQADEGGVMIGDSQEADTSSIATSQDISSVLASRAVRTFPQLANVNVLRSWAGFRVKTLDGLPIYEASPDHPGAYVVMCHSGVTLAANHALRIADAIAGRAATLADARFSSRRFHVSQH
ncbi:MULTISPECIES: FAD-dependent oxidoreductase [unclassified Rhizobium]|uniref:NAD(P)/FAD-dependent oxidoreductase n=1 Tax=unclassified Rhizobium TaxID=2613769 RepID=UPI0006F508E9|nr:MULTISPECIES: FAD-dependent oxidoreductase [unclassified Rhizobium]KQV40827.1 FAD-dependent oxidoreductase [Rhizobium sp. Root1212]KRD36115.1 FAD-dependent oxidoreductase [Rhizobium sp. Root268]